MRSHPGCGRKRTGSRIWFGSAFWSLYGIHAAGRRTWHFRFLRALLEETYGVSGALTVSAGVTTYGLVSGSMMGGPMQGRVLRSLALNQRQRQKATQWMRPISIDGQKFTNAARILAVAIGIGTIIFTFFKNVGLTMPAYIGAMLCAAAIRNIWDAEEHRPSDGRNRCAGRSLP